MRPYPSIPHVSAEHIGRECVGFRKYDGSNLRFEYSYKKGWYKFGTRTRLFDASDPVFGEAIALFLANLADPIEQTMRDDLGNPDRFIAFAEFMGPHSFAGIHDPLELGVEHNDPKDLVLIDVSIHKQGILDPERFVELFGRCMFHPQIIFNGPLTEEYLTSVRAGEVVVGEGMVFKGGSGHKLWMAKVKTEPYLTRLRQQFGQDWKQFE